jgi:polyisoprenoid-binding protein YceI
VFKLKGPFGAIEGSANGVSGSVVFDPQKPSATSGKLAVTTASMEVPNPLMKEHMHSGQWMDVTKFPEITFKTKEFKNAKTKDDTTTADVVGTLTMKNVAKEIIAPVQLTFLPDKLGQRVPNTRGDLLVLRSTFSIKRSDFGIGAVGNRGPSDEVELVLSAAGASAR